MSKDTIELNVPSKPEYISLIRLTTSGIGHKANLCIDEIEDLKVSVGEACVNIIKLTSAENINLKFNLSEKDITIDIHNVVGNIPTDLKNSQEAKLGLLIIESLMDEVLFTENGVRIVKYII
ncbi:MAG TPA: ATP-binding protein, partial [Tissierellaceae bacterium]